MSKDDKPAKPEPRLRFPEFRHSGPWSKERLGDFAAIIKGRGISKADVVADGKTPCVRYAELYTQYGDVINDIVSWTNLDPESLVLSEAGDVLIPASGESKADIATATCVTVDGVALGSDLNIIRSGLYGPFFSYYLNGPKRFSIAKVAQGDTVAHLYPKQLEQVDTLFPEPAEQRKIADCLGSLDDWITAETEALAALRRHRTSLMQQLFPRPGEIRPRIRFAEFRDADEWKLGRCRDIATVLQGYGFPEKYQGELVGDYPFYKVSDISLAVKNGRRYIAEAKNYIDDDKLKDLRARPVPAGTVIFAKIGEAIRSDRRVVTTRPAVIDNNTAGVKAREGKSSDGFLFYLWSNVSLIDHAGGVVPAVSKSSLENVPLTYPTAKAEQDRIANCLASLDTMIAAQADKLATLRDHRRGLMQQLFPAMEDR